MKKSVCGIAGMVRCAAMLSIRHDLDVASFGRSGDAPPQSCKLEMTGRHLLYDVTLDGGWLWLGVALLDKGDPPELLANFPDGPEGFKDVSQIIQAFEREGIRSLEKPIELGGGSGPNGWVIG